MKYLNPNQALGREHLLAEWPPKISVTQRYTEWSKGAYYEYNWIGYWDEL